MLSRQSQTWLEASLQASALVFDGEVQILMNERASHQVVRLISVQSRVQ